MPVGMAALVAARIGRAITARLAARLQTRTAGVPFLLRSWHGTSIRGALREGEEVGSAPRPTGSATSRSVWRGWIL